MKRWQEIKEDVGYFLASLISMIAMIITVIQAFWGFLRFQHNQNVFNIEVLLFILLFYQLFFLVKYTATLIRKLKIGKVTILRI